MKKLLLPLIILCFACSSVQAQVPVTIRVQIPDSVWRGVSPQSRSVLFYADSAQVEFIPASGTPSIEYPSMSQIGSSEIWGINMIFANSSIGQILKYTFWLDLPPFPPTGEELNLFLDCSDTQMRIFQVPEFAVTYTYCWQKCTQCDGTAPETISGNEVTGYIYHDQNNNQIKDTSESGIQSIPLQLNENNIPLYIVQSNNSGSFSFGAGSGEKTISVTLPSHLHTDLTQQIVSFPDTTGGNRELNFPVTITAGYKDLQIIPILPLMRAGFQGHMTLKINNNGTPVQNIHVNLALPESITLVSSAGVTQNGNNLSWEIAQLNSFEQNTIDLVFHIPSPPVFMPGDTATWSGNVEIQAGETNTQNNVFNLNVPIVAAYDPNDKTMLNGKSLSPAQANSGYPFMYRIRFQNTGNYPATFIHVRDTLEAGFDASTFRTLTASHDYSVTVNENRFIDWYFPNIELPDSTTDPEGSQGYILFTVNPILPLTITDSLSNTAHIYFDFNPAVITNTEVTRIVQSTGFDTSTENNIRLVNSISTGTIYLQGETASLKNIRLYSISGKLIQEWTGYYSGIFVADITDGFYLLECISEKGKSVNKLIISN